MTDTLRSTYEQCPHLRDPQLDFIPAGSTRHKQIILRDLRELVAAASGEHEKAVVLLAGSIFEAVLFSFLQGQQSYIEARREEFTFDEECGLETCKNIFNRWISGALPNRLRLPDEIVDYRNLVHINRELNAPPGVCAVASREMLRVLDSLLAELSEFAAPGW